MTSPALRAPPSGSAMDRTLPHPSRWRRAVLPTTLALSVLGLGWLVWQRAPQTLTVDAPRLAPARNGEFREELPLRARVEPLLSVQLDASEAGVVEAVLAHDGEHVAAGAPLYRLHSPEQEQMLMQRSAEVAQQMANVSVQRSSQAATQAQNRRELAQLRATQQQAAADYQRQVQLAEAGFVSRAALDQAQRQWQLSSQLLQQAEVDQRLEAEIQAQSLAEMGRAVQGLKRGLQLLERSRERLLQRAPMAGLLTGLQLRTGASVRPGDRLGRIDDPAAGIQLVAEVDEYYLPRLRQGMSASSPSGALRIAQVLPQVQDGKIKVLLRWAEDRTPSTASVLQAGQSLELRLQLSSPAPALLLPDGPGVLNPLYVRQGKELHRRSVQLGRRAAGQVEVLAGLRAGDEVLISQPPSDAERLALP